MRFIIRFKSVETGKEEQLLVEGDTVEKLEGSILDELGKCGATSLPDATYLYLSRDGLIEPW